MSYEIEGESTPANPKAKRQQVAEQVGGFVILTTDQFEQVLRDAAKDQRPLQPVQETKLSEEAEE